MASTLVRGKSFEFGSRLHDRRPVRLGCIWGCRRTATAATARRANPFPPKNRPPPPAARSGSAVSLTLPVDATTAVAAQRLGAGRGSAATPCELSDFIEVVPTK